jgi:hypothetical protein
MALSRELHPETDSARYDHRGDTFVVTLDRIWLSGFFGIAGGGMALEVTRRRSREAPPPRRSSALWLAVAFCASFMMLPVRPRSVTYSGYQDRGFRVRMLAIVSLAGHSLWGTLQTHSFAPEAIGIA